MVCFYVRDGLSIDAFHKKCDNNGPTLNIIRSRGFLFGGFSPIPWSSPFPSSSQHHPSSFLFSLSNPHGLPPTRYFLQKESKVSIWQLAHRGISFGGEVLGYDDMTVVSDSKNVYIAFPHSYDDTTGWGANTFTGHAYDNPIEEILVFSVY